MPALPELRDELLGRTERELVAADALFEAVEADRSLSAELERRLSGPAAALGPALEAWDAAPPEAQALLDVNAGNAAWLDGVIGEHGWPGLRLVGAQAADAAWMLAQHADRHSAERRAWLEPLATAVASGDADPRHLAALTDRVAAIAGEPQVYGTIATLASDGEVEHLVPVADPARLDDRRREMGLPRMADEGPALVDGDLVPYGPQRGDAPLNQWPIVLEGHVSAEAALDAGVRRVHRVWAARPGDRRLGRLRALARERGVTIEQVDRGLIDEVARGRTHGGVVALVGPRTELRLPELLDEVGEDPLLVMLDGIEDPFNQGQAVRALYAAGVAGLIGRRSWETAASVVTRASAGATELLPTARVSSAEEAAAACRRAGLRVVVAVTDEDALELHDADLRGGLLLLIGGERRGATRSFVEHADSLIRIGYGRDRAPELGAAAAAAVIGFEALRQRRAGSGVRG